MYKGAGHGGTNVSSQLRKMQELIKKVTIEKEKKKWEGGHDSSHRQSHTESA
jgi:uncharacterized sporulation protein YeaH/YhbH (DUF444 family)